MSEWIWTPMLLVSAGLMDVRVDLDWTPMLLVSAGLMDVRVEVDADVVGQRRPDGCPSGSGRRCCWSAQA